MAKKGVNLVKSSSCISSTLEPSPTSEIDHQQQRQQQQRATRVINAASKMSVTTKSTNDGQYKLRRPIKKAHVRFDDYLDLNEENMRRSCKRLMNRLYHEPGSDSQQVAAQGSCSLSAPAASATSVCRPPNSPPPLLLGQADDGRTDQSPVASRSVKNLLQLKAVDQSQISGHDAVASSRAPESLPPPSNEKSYLRSQYERRQKRQIELMQQQQQKQQTNKSEMMSKLNLTADARSCNQNDNNEMTSRDGGGPGANNNICQGQQVHQQLSQQQQQDLVAKSHELSKRRFFEKLERRESMKNSTPPNTQDERQLLQASSGARAFKQVQQQQHPQPPESTAAFDQQRQQQLKRQQMLPTKAHNIGKENLPGSDDDGELKIFQEPVLKNLQLFKPRELIARGDGSSGCGGIGATPKGGEHDVDAQQDEQQLMLKVYQSMVTSGKSQLAQYCRDITTAVAQTQDTHGRASRPPTNAKNSSVPMCDLLADELIGSHASTPQQQVPHDEPVTAGKPFNESQRAELGVPTSVNDEEEHPLIEFSKGQQKNSLTPASEQFTGGSCCSGASSESRRRRADSPGLLFTTQREEHIDSSEFEIKVPADLSSCSLQDHADLDSACFIDRLLVVKQVRCDDGMHFDEVDNAGLANSAIGGSNNGVNQESWPASKSSAAQLENNKTLINPTAALLINKICDDDSVTRQIKEQAAHASSQTGPNDDDDYLQRNKTAGAQISDNQQQQETVEVKRVISPTTNNNANRVNQESRDLKFDKLKYHDDADKMKKYSNPIITTTNSFNTTQTTSNSLANSNNAPDIDPHSENRLHSVGAERSDHETPETNMVFTSRHPPGGASENELDKLNETMASAGHKLLALNSAAATAIAQVQQVNTIESLATIAEDEVSSGGGDSAHKFTGNPIAAQDADEVGTDADEAAASLETIITSERETRDVPPEANAVLSSTTAVAPASARSQSTPLNHCDTQGQVERFSQIECASERVVEREIEHEERARRFIPVGQVAAAALEIEEVEKVDQKGESHAEGSLEGQLKQQLSIEDEHHHDHQQREQDLSKPKEQEQYANPSSIQPAAAASSSHQGNHVHDLRENNVNHDGRRGALKESSGSPQECTRMQRCENVGINLIGSGGDFMGNHYLIEPSQAKSTNGTVNQTAQRNFQVAFSERLISSSSVIDPTAEEDIGSSCSSSGFGASVSAPSSTTSDDHRASHHPKSKSTTSQSGHHQHHHHKRLTTMPVQNVQMYDTLRAGIRAGDSSLHDVVREESNYQKVGPDQAYPSAKERPMLVENYGYTSLVHRCRTSALPPLPPPLPHHDSCRPLAQTKAPDHELYSSAHYANLPASIRMQKAPVVEYATVTAASRNAGSGVGNCTANIPPTENKRHSALQAVDRQPHHRPSFRRGSTSEPLEPDDCESSLSGHNLSTSSANSGGFSMLPPVRLIDHNFANNLDFLKSLEPGSSIYGESHTSGNQQQPQQQALPKKSPSLFKRFGSLVSRAFTTSASMNGGEIDCGSSGHFSNDSITPHSLSNETQSLSLNNAQSHHHQLGPASPSRAHECSNVTASKHEHKSSRLVKDPTSGESGHVSAEETLYATTVTRARSRMLAKDHGKGDTGAKINNSKPLALAEADLVILPTKHSKDNQRKSDTYGGATLRPGHKSAAAITTSATVAQEDCRARGQEAKMARGPKQQSSRDVSEPRRLIHRQALTAASLSPRSSSVSIASSYSSSSSIDYSSLSELCGPTSLIDQSHAHSDMRLDCANARRSGGGGGKFARESKRHYAKLGVREMGSSHDTTREPSSMLYASLQQAHSLQITNEPRREKSWRISGSNDGSKRTDEGTSSDNEGGTVAQERSNELVVNEGKCRSLNLYQNLLRNYVKRRHHHRHHHHGHNRGHHHYHHHGHHHHNHHDHHQHSNKHSSSTRHAHCSSTTRCGQQQCSSATGKVCNSKNCSSFSGHSSNKNNSTGTGTGDVGTHGDKGSVWGQLIKINKSEGSQVIELQRAPNRSWGFFVARGAINNMKGIFISRMHDSATGSSLTGLLSIGDRILSIDNCALEPDDILRVNQMISKKSKILLKVKPFKG